ncbi:MAG: hypothetical protein MUF32_03570 [Burkholderiaceae bacterium]|jgi:hypothetical protein|nr:hypothetical protein [Burkholderiaceae bacterium]
MTELHYALIAAAVILLLLLLAWSKWQERRQGRAPDERPGAAQGEAPPPTAAAGGRIEPRLGDLPAEADRQPPHPRPQLPGWVEDPMLDCVLELRCAHAVDGVTVIDATGPLLRLDCGLPAHVVAWDARSEQWVLPDRFGFYAELLASIQLANRSRRLGDIEASQFIAAVQQVALSIDADFDPPELPLLRRRAAELEAKIAQFDVQIGLTLQPAEGLFNPTAAVRAALAVGLEPDGERRWLRRGEDGSVLFRLQLTEQHLLALELDVPTAPPAAQPLRAMFATASELAALLGASVVDDHGRPVTPGSIEAIEPPLQSLYERMRAADLEAGSARARRLFA